MSALAGRLSRGGGHPLRTREDSSVMSRLQFKSHGAGIGKTLAKRLGGPSKTIGNSGVKARLGSSGDNTRKIQDARTAILNSRNRTSGDNSLQSPVMVKIAGGKLVGGMRSDSVKKSRQRAPSRSLPDLRKPSRSSVTSISMDSRRGLTVKLDTNKRMSASSLRGGGGSDERGSSRQRNRYSQHDDRFNGSENSLSDHEERRRPLPPVRVTRKPPLRLMDIDTSNGRDRSPFYNSAPRELSPESFSEYEEVPRRLMHRRSLTPEAYIGGGRYDDSPPPPPSPPSFHPRQQYVYSSPSPPPAAVKRRKQIPDEEEIAYKLGRRLVSKTKKSKVSDRKVIAKSLSSSGLKKKEMALKGVTRTIKMKVPKKKKSVPGSRKSKSIKISSSSSSSSDSSSSSESEKEEPPKTKLPKPHKQVLDPEVLENIAALQGKEPGYKSGPGPGVKNLQFVPNKTVRTLNLRFTAFESPRIA